MKTNLLIVCGVIFSQLSFAQTPPKEYFDLVKKADSLYSAKDYKSSAFTYSEAFKANGWLALATDRYNAACSWALAGYADSAFFNLERIVSKSFYKNYNHITTDSDLNSLHPDKRWQLLIDQVKANKEKAEVNLNKPLAHQLDSIYVEDQKYRQMINEHEEKYGRQSKEMSELWGSMHKKDSTNLVLVKSILDKHGWLGSDEVGESGNTTLFLVIQHSDLQTQEKYLPKMKEAVIKGKAAASQLALLIDRVEMGNGRPQIYGSQITMKDDKYVIYQIIDEVNVNKRRAEVGLEPLEDYVRNWNIEYKLPSK